MCDVCVCVCVCLCVAGVGLVCCATDVLTLVCLCIKVLPTHAHIQLSLMHRITEKICKERWQHWCTKISGVKVLPTLLISTITSNMSFIQLSLMLSGYPASS